MQQMNHSFHAPAAGRCPSCGAPFTQGAYFCDSCGVRLVQPEIDIEQQAYLGTGAGTAVKSKKGIRILIVTLLVLIAAGICAFILYRTFGKGPAAANELFFVSNPKTMTTHIYKGAEVFEELLDGIVESDIRLNFENDLQLVPSHVTNQDGDDSYRLYLIDYRSEEIDQVADDFIGKAEHCAFSVAGQKVLYLNEDDKLYLYDHKTKERTLVAKEARERYGHSGHSDMAISPDGNTVVYRNQKGEMHLYEDGESTKIKDHCCPVAVSDSGDYLFYRNDSGGLYVRRRGESLQIAEDADQKQFYFNRDHTQIIYYEDEMAFLSIEGKEGKRIGSKKTYPVTPNDGITKSMYAHHVYGLRFDTAISSITLNTESLLDHFYCDEEKSKLILQYVDGEFNKSKLENVTGYEFADKGESLYVLQEDESKKKTLYKVSGHDFENKTTIVKNTDLFTVSDNDSQLYYIKLDKNYNDVLWCRDDKGEAARIKRFKEITLFVNFWTAADDSLIALDLDGTLYTCTDDSNFKKVSEDVQSLAVLSDGNAYYIVQNKDDAKTYDIYAYDKEGQFVRIDQGVQAAGRYLE